MLFDLNFQALGVPPAACFGDASDVTNAGEELKPGDYLPVSFAEHYTAELQGNLSGTRCREFPSTVRGSGYIRQPLLAGFGRMSQFWRNLSERRRDNAKATPTERNHSAE
jgi:hypothetical protein